MLNIRGKILKGNQNIMFLFQNLKISNDPKDDSPERYTFHVPKSRTPFKQSALKSAFLIDKERFGKIY